MNAKASFLLTLIEAVFALTAFASGVRDWLTSSSNGLTALCLMVLAAFEISKMRGKAKARWATRKDLEAAGAHFVVYAHPPGARTLVRGRVPRSQVSPMQTMLGDQNVHAIFFDHQPSESELTRAAQFSEAAIFGPSLAETADEAEYRVEELGSHRG